MMISKKKALLFAIGCGLPILNYFSCGVAEAASSASGTGGFLDKIAYTYYGSHDGKTPATENANVTIAAGMDDIRIVFGGWYDVIKSQTVETEEQELAQEAAGQSEAERMAQLAAPPKNVMNNIVTVNGGDIGVGLLDGDTICGGHTVNGDAIGNKVYINNGNIGKADINGGRTLNGSAIDNEIHINGGSFQEEVVAGQAGMLNTVGMVKNNKIFITGGADFTDDIIGGELEKGDGYAIGNEVHILGNSTFHETVIGGAVDTGNGSAMGNLVSIENGTYEPTDPAKPHKTGVYGGLVQGGNGEAVNNTVLIKGGTIKTKVVGGEVELTTQQATGSTGMTWLGSGNAVGNKVHIQGGTIGGDVIGGGFVYAMGALQEATTAFTGQGHAINNNVYIEGGTVNGMIYGGISECGNAIGNEVYIANGSSVNNFVYGGKSTAGNALGNRVAIQSGTTVTQDVYGGISTAGAANENNVVLMGNSIVSANVYGGVGTTGMSNNRLVMFKQGNAIGNVAAVQIFKPHWTVDTNDGDVVLNITGAEVTDVANQRVLAQIHDNEGANFVGPTITLYNKTGSGAMVVDGLITKALAKDTAIVRYKNAEFVYGAANKTLTLHIPNDEVQVDEEGKSPAETKAAAVAFVKSGTDFLLNQGLNQAKLAAEEDKGDFVPFAAVGGENMRHDTGSYVDLKGWHGTLGVARTINNGTLLIAGEYGSGNYDSYLDGMYGSHGSGNVKTYGLAVAGEWQRKNGIHADASLRIGKAKTDYVSNLNDYRVNCDDSYMFYGLTLGIGKEFAQKNDDLIDVYGRYYYTHANASSNDLTYRVNMAYDAVDSHRLRIGCRYKKNLSKQNSFFAGVAWEHEFGGTVNSQAHFKGLSLSAPAPALRGSSGLLELGLSMVPDEGNHLGADININAWAGKQRGIAGSVGLHWSF